MHYSQSSHQGVSESKVQWKPIKQMSYVAKLNSFAADNATGYSCNHADAEGAHYQHQCWSPNNDFNQMNFQNSHG